MLLHFFLSGLALGASVCGLHISFLLGPVVARGCVNWREGIRAGFLFGAGKTAVYAALGAASAGAGYHVSSLDASVPFRAAGGGVMFLMGIWFLLFRGKCGRIVKTGPPLLLGLADGAFPCGPMIGFMVYLAYAGGGILFGAASGALFGAGTVAGPALLVCGGAPWLWKRISRIRKAGVFLRLAGALVFFLWGINLVYRV